MDSLLNSALETYDALGLGPMELVVVAAVLTISLCYLFSKDNTPKQEVASRSINPGSTLKQQERSMEDSTGLVDTTRSSMDDEDKSVPDFLSDASSTTTDSDTTAVGLMEQHSKDADLELTDNAPYIDRHIETQQTAVQSVTENLDGAETDDPVDKKKKMCNPAVIPSATTDDATDSLEASASSRLDASQPITESIPVLENSGQGASTIEPCDQHINTAELVDDPVIMTTTTRSVMIGLNEQPPVVTHDSLVPEEALDVIEQPAQDIHLEPVMANDLEEDSLVGKTVTEETLDVIEQPAQDIQHEQLPVMINDNEEDNLVCETEEAETSTEQPAQDIHHEQLPVVVNDDEKHLEEDNLVCETEEVLDVIETSATQPAQDIQHEQPPVMINDDDKHLEEDNMVCETEEVLDVIETSATQPAQDIQHEQPPVMINDDDKHLEEGNLVCETATEEALNVTETSTEQPAQDIHHDINIAATRSVMTDLDTESQQLETESVGEKISICAATEETLVEPIAQVQTKDETDTAQPDAHDDIPVTTNINNEQDGQCTTSLTTAENDLPQNIMVPTKHQVLNPFTPYTAFISNPTNKPKQDMSRIERIGQQRQPYIPLYKSRCTFWPGCTNNHCKYYHPFIECRNGKACEFGKKCVFLHPKDYNDHQKHTTRKSKTKVNLNGKQQETPISPQHDIIKVEQASS